MRPLAQSQEHIPAVRVFFDLRYFSFFFLPVRSFVLSSSELIGDTFSHVSCFRNRWRIGPSWSELVRVGANSLIRIASVTELFFSSRLVSSLHSFYRFCFARARDGSRRRGFWRGFHRGISST